MDTATPQAIQFPGNGSVGDCPSVPEFRRLNYIYGQLLGVADFKAEQSYFRDKLRLHNRCLHGYGVVCGLLLSPAGDSRDHPASSAGTQAKAETASPPAPDAPPVRVVIDCGIALDCQGNELVVRRPLPVDVWRELNAEDRKKAELEPQDVYISLCFCEQPIDPVRPVLSDQCGAIAECSYGKLRESVRVKVSLTGPEEDERCETCCTGCGECCVLLARIEKFRRGVPIDPSAIHNEVRRRLGLYQPTVITGVNWLHGAQYSRANAEAILGTDDEKGGLVIHFSRPVYASSFQRGVIEMWRIEGSGGRGAYLAEITGEFLDMGKSEWVTQVRYRQLDGEPLDPGDRILIIVRCAFILDRCCRPVDGAHVGGRVPQVDGAIKPEISPKISNCPIPPWGYAPWTSGNGSPGSTFESWIIVSDKDDRKRHARSTTEPGAPS